MEISNETKAKVFAPLIGVEFKCITEHFKLPNKIFYGILLNDNNEYALCLRGENNKRADYYSVNEWLPILKPLSAITDEDAIDMVKIICPEAKNVFVSSGIINYDYDFLDINMDGEHDLKDIGNVCFPPCVYQFLISKGYDLPQYLLNDKTLFESGLCTYETN